MIIFRLLLAVFAVLPCAAASYRFGAIWDGEKRVVNACINIVRDHIESVGPCGANATDMSRYTAIPGLIDMHTHMTYVSDNPVSQSGRAAALVYLARENALKTLQTGVTTVRDLGSQIYADIAMRDLIAKGMMKGPRMFVAGYGLQSARGRPARPNFASGVDEVRRVVTEQVEAGADWIKMYGSTGSGQDVSGDQTFTFEEMKTAVETAHGLGKRIAIHSYGPAGASDAVRAGADTLEHATDIDAATIQRMVERKIWYVPTIDHNRFYVDNFKLLGFAPGAVAGLNSFIERNLATAKIAFKAGVRFAMGSDAVMSMFGENTRELQWFVKAGMTPEEALKTATVNAAEALGMGARLGALKPGWQADVVAVEGDPLADIDFVVYRVRWVMKDGEVVVDKR